MKKLYDICASVEENEIILHGDSPREMQLVGEGDSFTDISAKSSNTDQDISLQPESKIHIGKKRTQNFDALEIPQSMFHYKKKVLSLQHKNFHPFKYTGKIFGSIKRQYSRYGIWGFIVGFLLISLIYTASAKIVIENRVNAGYEKLLSIRKGHISLTEIQRNVNNARVDFFLSKVLFTPFTLIPSEKIQSVKHTIHGGAYIAHGLDTTLALYSKVKTFTDTKGVHDIYFTQLFLNTYAELKNISEYFSNGRDEYTQISWLPSPELYEKKENVIAGLGTLLHYLENYLEKFPEFLSLLGHHERKRYLIVFQNADEIRPTGGFMGSMGLLEIFKGKVKLFEKKDVYAIEWDLKGSNYERLPAPKGISELTPVFGLRDANYYANVQDSSHSIKFFMDKAGIKIDGIVYVNQNILLKLLKITGPIYFEPIGMEITHENFSEIMSLMVEAKVSKTSTLESPKRILFDFMEVFLHTLMRDAQYVDYLQVLMQESQNRDMLMWSFNSQDNAFLKAMKLTGKIDYASTLDSVYPVYTSLSGNKSDRYMSYLYTHSVTKNKENCSFNISHTIKSSHNMPKKSRESIQKLMKKYHLNTPHLFKIQGADRNRQYVRMILPQNAQIFPQKGMEIVEYGTRKGVEFFLTTPEQQASYYTFSYTLPNPQCNLYTFTLYKQPGIKSFDVRLNLGEKEFEYFNREKDFYFEERE